MKCLAPFLLIFCLCLHAMSQKRLANLKSPDRQISVHVTLSPSGQPEYSVEYGGKMLMETSPLSLHFKEDSTFQLSAGKATTRKIDETYSLIVGKASTVHQQAQEARIPLTDTSSGHRLILIFRAYNDGVAFRYEFPEQEGWTSYTLLGENSAFNLSGDPLTHSLYWGYFVNDHEGLYQHERLSTVRTDTLLDLPALFQYDDGRLVAITEAALRDYAGMYLSKDSSGALRSRLSPHLDDQNIKVTAGVPNKTPWRVMMIGKSPATLLESNILTNLNEPPQGDYSWLHPGKTSFHWWNGDITPDTTFAPGVNFETNKYYIDFCARHDIDYHAVIGYGGFAWYQNNWTDYGNPGTYADVTKPVPGFDMQRVCDYAHSQGVGIHVWVHWQALYPQLEEAFDQFEKWGINGMMVDFLNRDDQEMVRIEEEILKSAARHHLYIQFHGSHKPTGLHRTYPNLLTREGTYNYERNKWLDAPVPASHDLDIAFTRLLAGPTDYHLGGFRAVPADSFKTQFTRPLMGGTRCHMLGMYVILESYLSMVADYPKAYEGEPGFEFIRHVPTVWDETHVPAAQIGGYAIIARRKGNDWYVGGINSEEARTVSVPLDFLSAGSNYTLTLYLDADDAQAHPNALKKQSRTVTNKDSVEVNMAGSGGVAMELIRQSE